jgi:glyoxylase-like metal-dependent hydrolase (beta-lactamase superfamily II)
VTAFRVGDVSVSRVEEMMGPGFEPAYLFPDFDEDRFARHLDWMVPAYYDPAAGRFIASIHTWVLQTRHHTILVDSCTGNHKRRPAFARFDMLDLPFLDRLASAGVAPADVDFVLCTHLHIDHVGWNTRLENGRWVPTFPNARYVVSRTEHDHWDPRISPIASLPENEGVYDDSVLPVSRRDSRC